MNPKKHWFAAGLVVGVFIGPPIGFWALDHFRLFKPTGLEAETARAEQAMVETMKIGEEIAVKQLAKGVAPPSASLGLNQTPVDPFPFVLNRRALEIAARNSCRDASSSKDYEFCLKVADAMVAAFMKEPAAQIGAAKAGPCDGPPQTCPEGTVCGCRDKAPE